MVLSSSSSTKLYHQWMEWGMPSLDHLSQSYDKKELLRTTPQKFFELKNKPFPENIFGMEELSLIDELRKCHVPERYFGALGDAWEVNSWEDVELEIVVVVEY